MGCAFSDDVGRRGGASGSLVRARHEKVVTVTRLLLNLIPPPLTVLYDPVQNRVSAGPLLTDRCPRVKAVIHLPWVVGKEISRRTGIAHSMEDRTPRPRVDNHSSVTRLDEDKVKFDAGSCEELGKASMKCLSDIGYDKDKATVVCKVHYDAYRECRKQQNEAKRKANEEYAKSFSLRNLFK